MDVSPLEVVASGLPPELGCLCCRLQGTVAVTSDILDGWRSWAIGSRDALIAP